MHTICFCVFLMFFLCLFAIKYISYLHKEIPGVGAEVKCRMLLQGGGELGMWSHHSSFYIRPWKRHAYIDEKCK